MKIKKLFILIGSTNHKEWVPYNNTQIIDTMARKYNRRFCLNSSPRLTSEEFHEYHGIEYSNYKENNAAPFLRTFEMLTIKAANNLYSDKDLCYHSDLNCNLGVPKLSFNGNPRVDYGFYSDIKDMSLAQGLKKLDLTLQKGKANYQLEGSGKQFGCNLYVVSVSEKKYLILSFEQKMLEYLNGLRLRYQYLYNNLDFDGDYKNFEVTCDLKDF